MQCRRATILAAVMLLAATGCYYHVGLISLESSSTASALSHREVQSAVAAIGRTVVEFGMIPDRRLDWISSDSRDSKVIDNVVFGIFSVDSDAHGNEWVEVRAVVEKRSGKFIVIIIDYGWEWATKFTDEVEQAVPATLQRKFPDREVRVKRKTTGPNLGP